MRTTRMFGAIVAALAAGSLVVSPASAQWHHHGGVGAGYHAPALHGGHFAHGFHGGHIGGWGYRGFVGAGGPYYYGGYGYDYPYDYGYDYPYDYGYNNYDPGAAVALGAITAIAGLIAHQAYRHHHVYHRYRHRR